MALKKSLVASAFSLSFLTLLSRVLGLVRETTKAKFLGTSVYADAFTIAFMIPNLFRRLFAENSISVAFIPTFRGYISKAGDETEDGAKREAIREAREFVGATLTLVTFMTTLVVSAGIAAAPLIVPFFYKGDEPSALAEMTLLTRIMFPYLLVISVAAFFQGILNGVKVFAPSGFTPVLFNIIVIAATYALSPFMANPARAMAVGVAAGGIVQAAFQLPFVVRTGWAAGFRTLRAAFTNPGTRRVCALVVPTIVGMAAYQLNDAVSTALAGGAETGTVASLQYSLRLQELILGVFAVSIGTVILPDLSALAKRREWGEFNGMLSQALKIIALISVPVTFFSLVTGTEIISLVYKSDSFDDKSVEMTLSAFRWHIAGLLFIALNRVVSPAFYAQGDTKSPTAAGLLGFAVNIALALALVRPLGGAGIAMALSAASLANTVALLAMLRRNPGVNVRSVAAGTALYALKLAVLSAAAAYPTRVLRGFLVDALAGRGRLVSFGVPLAACGILYAVLGIGLLALSRDEILRVVVGKVRRGRGGRRAEAGKSEKVAEKSVEQ